MLDESFSRQLLVAIARDTPAFRPPDFFVRLRGYFSTGRDAPAESGLSSLDRSIASEGTSTNLEMVQDGSAQEIDETEQSEAIRSLEALAVPLRIQKAFDVRYGTTLQAVVESYLERLRGGERINVSGLTVALFEKLSQLPVAMSGDIDLVGLHRLSVQDLSNLQDRREYLQAEAARKRRLREEQLALEERLSRAREEMRRRRMLSERSTSAVGGLNQHFARVDLSGSSFRYRDDLGGADFSGSTVDGCDFEGASLAGASFEGASAVRANFKSANLAGANLVRANLLRANLRNSILRGAHLRDANLSGADLRGADLQDAEVKVEALGGATFDDETILPTEVEEQVRRVTVINRNGDYVIDVPPEEVAAGTLLPG